MMTIFSLSLALAEAVQRVPDTAMWGLMIAGMAVSSIALARNRRTATVYA